MLGASVARAVLPLRGLSSPPLAIVAVGLAVTPADRLVDHRADLPWRDADAVGIGGVAQIGSWIAPLPSLAGEPGDAAALLAFRARRGDAEARENSQT